MLTDIESLGQMAPGKNVDFYPPVNPEEDQTAGYHADGEPWMADDPVVFWPEVDHEHPVLVESETGLTGPVRMTTVGDPVELAKQPREPNIIVGHDQNADTRAYPMRNAQFDPPQVVAPVSQGGEIVGFRLEARRITGTALHEAHTMASWPTVQSQDPLAAVRQIGLGGGFYSVEGQIYVHQRDLFEQQEAARLAPQPAQLDDIPF